MLTWKGVTYTVTLALALLCAFWELRMKRQLSDKAIEASGYKNASGSLNDMSEKIERERLLSTVPKEDLKALRAIVVLKFVFVAVLIVEVIVLQK